MKKCLFYLSVLSVCLVFGSCSTDFDINAEKKDITVVYGLLNQNDTAQFIKITRAFLGETSAYEMAQDPSQSSYGDDLDVKVDEIVNGVKTRTFYLQKVIIHIKEAGVFYYPDQEVYRFKPAPALNVNATYQLTISNKVSGKITSSSTVLIPDFTIIKPAYNPDNPLIGFVGSNGSYTTSEAAWKSAKYARVYEPAFRFHYKEVNKTTHDTVYNAVDWSLNTVYSEFLNGGEELSTTYSGESFYKLLQARIPVNPDVDRYAGKVDFLVSAGADDLSIYMDLNQPSNTIIQERPAYTNISNGIGIFSSRYIKKFSYNLTVYSWNELANGQYTSQLGFK